ncbi:MAG: ABC transporter ATP-binding protein [Gemmatimonadota bacterium]|nr:ABC transporter ATP-binding protein [Gemmatimonadota bacterium]
MTLPTELDRMSLTVETESLTKRFGAKEALRGLDLQVPEGAVYLLVGPNGAGKTTTLRILMNLLKADSGAARVLSFDPRRDGPEVRARTGYVPERHDRGYPWMTVARTIEHHAAYRPGWDAAYANRLAEVFEIEAEREFGDLSKGQARRVQLLLALAHRPPLLLLDEPTDGLDPVMRDVTLGLLAEHVAESPTTLLISTHRVYEMERMADHVGVLHEGRLLAQTSRERLHRMLRRYLLQIPERWEREPDLDGVVRKSGNGREVQWTVWGEEAEVSDRLARAGATVREVVPLTLDEATITLLGRREEPEGGSRGLGRV